MASGWSGSVSNSSASPDEQLTEEIQKINRQAGALAKDMKDLGTKKDNPQLRQRMNNTRTEASQTAKNGRNLLSQNKGKIEKVKYERLAKAFNDAVKELETITRQSLEKERDALSRSTRASIDGVSKATPEDQQFMKQFTSDESVVTTAAIIEEQNKDILQIEKDLNALHEVFIDVANLVNTQGEQLNVIEANTQSAVVNTTVAVGELKQANKYSTAFRKKVLYLIIILLVVILIIGLGAGLGNAKNK